MDRRTAVPARAGGVAVLLALLLVMSGAVTVLALRAAHLVTTLSGTRPEPFVELLAVALGAVAATWVGISALVGLGCVVVRALGSSWGAGERLVLRVAPAVVRRAVRAGVGLTVGAGLVLAGGTAQAATTPDADPGVVAVDLGWQASAPAPGPPGPTQPPAPLPTDESAPAAPHTRSAPPTAAERPGPAVSAPAAQPSGLDVVVPDARTATPVTPGTPSAPGAVPSMPSTGEPAGATAPGTATTDSSAPARAPEGGSATTEQRDAALAVVRDVAPDEPREVVVVRGDSLWSIAARHLPDGATDAQVADAVQRWYAANVEVVGDDPDLVRPGQVLVAPSA
ncbi:LysM peptidoglycan-binding domain-containing protein [Cellulosimicrobium cellulans]|uniref:LysM peptidoglycan-binding domain-containing protein n=1 Tax=Cellulosimicrobium cellulans TaxID=1710 RepID=UPI002096E2B6|nr:LysM peptidoglycan-binding domain-containing protein [Cellulosimicrobium cellulans]MCO7274346.1 LysM peptidoglycan-binding domain-containing protein [Cellulosimicrobium cellulans]